MKNFTAIQKAPKLLSGEIVEVYSFKGIILLKLKTYNMKL